MEVEARIALESAGHLSAGVKSMLDRRTELTWMLPPRPEGLRIGEYSDHWQERCWDLYAAAAAACGGQTPGAAEKSAFFR